MSSEAQPPKILPGRGCGECSLCCKLMQVDEFDKPQGTWCRHCAPGRGGCTIHETRPSICRDFYCGWLVGANLGPEWRPLTCKMIVFFEKNGFRLAVHVDPDHPAAWRREPWYSQLKQWSRPAIEAGQQIVVYIKRRAIVVLPDRDVDFGELDPRDRIRVGTQMTPEGQTWSAVKIAAKDVPPEQAGKWITSDPAKRKIL
jgi:hypothetical protein